MMNILFCSVGRRGELVKNFRQSMGTDGKIIAADNSRYAPAMYLADQQYVVPRIDAPEYIPTLLKICGEESVQAITTFIDPEIALLSRHRSEFEAIGVEVLAPYEETAKRCFDKYQMYHYLKDCHIATTPTYGDLDEFEEAYRSGDIQFPVFVKPRTGSGSVGACKVETMEQLELLMEENPSLIIQKLMVGTDIDVDVYIDTFSKQAVSIFCKKKLETRIGGANKTVSFKDEKLFDLVKEIVKKFEFNGPVDMDFFCVDGTYYLSEINPRFGGAYLHAYGAGVDFVKLIINNIAGKENAPEIGAYDGGVVMMMYDSVVIRKEEEMAEYL